MAYIAIFIIVFIGLVLIVFLFYINPINAIYGKLNLRFQLPDSFSMIKRVIEFGIAISITTLSFLGAFIISAHKTNVDKEERFKSILEVAQIRSKEYFSYLHAYHPDSTNHLDSNALKWYKVNSFKNPFYIVDQVSADQLLVYFSQLSYLTISDYESDDKSCRNAIADTSLPVAYRVRCLEGSLLLNKIKYHQLIDEERSLEGTLDESLFVHTTQSRDLDSSIFYFEFVNSCIGSTI